MELLWSPAIQIKVHFTERCGFKYILLNYVVWSMFYWTMWFKVRFTERYSLKYVLLNDVVSNTFYWTMWFEVCFTERCGLKYILLHDVVLQYGIHRVQRSLFALGPTFPAMVNCTQLEMLRSYWLFTHLDIKHKLCTLSIYVKGRMSNFISISLLLSRG